MLKRNVQNLNKEYLLICIVKVGVGASALTAPFSLLVLRQVCTVTARSRDRRVPSVTLGQSQLPASQAGKVSPGLAAPFLTPIPGV